MKAPTAVNATILITVAVAAYFWTAWYFEINTYRTATSAIHATLVQQKLTDVRVYPLHEGCYSYNAKRGGYEIVTGKVCLPE